MFPFEDTSEVRMASLEAIFCANSSVGEVEMVVSVLTCVTVR